MHGTSDRFSALIRKLSGLADLTQSDLHGIAALPSRVERLRAGATIVEEGERVTDCYVLVDGYACRHKLARDGGRQIVSFHVAGDVLDVQHLLFDRADHNVQTITDAEVVFVPMAELRRLVDMSPALAKALWRDALVDASIFREWVLNVGRRNARTRIAHLLCEFAVRRQAAGLGEPERFTLPMTQEQIGDATGLTAVHVNRMLRELREDGAIGGSGREIAIADWARLQRAADFDPAYLHLAA